MNSLKNILQPNFGWQRQSGQCAEHGPYQGRTISNHALACPRCVDERKQRGQAQHQQAQLAKQWERRLRQAGVQARFQGKGFAQYAPVNASAGQAKQLVEQYCQAFAANLAQGRCLVLAGKPGTGKNHLAAAMVQELITRQHSALIIKAYDCVEHIKATWSRDAKQSESEIMRRFIGPDLLVLDEVGAQFGSDTEKLLLFRVLDGRYEQMRPTVVISNEAEAGLKKYLGERAFDRLRENGGMMIGFDWPSYRGAH